MILNYWEFWIIGVWIIEVLLYTPTTLHLMAWLFFLYSEAASFTTARSVTTSVATDTVCNSTLSSTTAVTENLETTKPQITQTSYSQTLSSKSVTSQVSLVTTPDANNSGSQSKSVTSEVLTTQETNASGSQSTSPNTGTVVGSSATNKTEIATALHSDLPSTKIVLLNTTVISSKAAAMTSSESSNFFDDPINIAAVSTVAGVAGLVMVFVSVYLLVSHGSKITPACSRYL